MFIQLRQPLDTKMIGKKVIKFLVNQTEAISYQLSEYNGILNSSNYFELWF